MDSAVEGQRMSVLEAEAISQPAISSNIYRKNQDSTLITHDPATNSCVLGVFDGHGEAGNVCSLFLKRELPLLLSAHPLWSLNVLQTFSDVGRDIGFRMADPSEAKKLCLSTEFSGATCTIIVIRSSTLYIMHIGACRAVLLSRISPPFAKPKAINGTLFGTALTEDHRCDLPRERRRIIEDGGRVFGVAYNDGTRSRARLWLPNFDVPGLAVSRSYGDSIALRHAGLSSHAETGAYHWSDRGETAIILATDGLWDVISNDEAASIVSQVLQQQQQQQQQNMDSQMPSLSTTIADALIKEAQRRWLQGIDKRSDDISVVVALLSG